MQTDPVLSVDDTPLSNHCTTGRAREREREREQAVSDRIFRRRPRPCSHKAWTLDQNEHYQRAVWGRGGLHKWSFPGLWQGSSSMLCVCVCVCVCVMYVMCLTWWCSGCEAHWAHSPGLSATVDSDTDTGIATAVLCNVWNTETESGLSWEKSSEWAQPSENMSQAFAALTGRSPRCKAPSIIILVCDQLLGAGVEEISSHMWKFRHH